MSLLMDALKKAEQEKREAAKRVKETEELALKEKDRVSPPAEEDTGTDEERDAPESVSPEGQTLSRSMELSLTPLENGYAARQEVSRGRNNTDQELHIEEDNDGSWSSESSSSEQEDAESDSDLTIGAHELEMVHEAETDDEEEDVRESREGAATRGESSSLDETFHGLDFDQTGDLPEADTSGSDATRPREETGRIYEETLPGVPAVQLAEDIGGNDQPTPVAAQTIFSAGNSTAGEGGSAFKWALIAAAAVMVVSAGVWYYYAVTPINRDLPSPMVARGIETIQPITSEQRQQLQAPEAGGSTASQSAPPAPAPETAATPGPDAGTASSPAPSVETAATGERPAPAPETSPAGDARAGAEAGGPANTASTANTAEPSPERPPEPEAATAPSPPPEDLASAPDRLPDAIQPPSSLIRISRSSTPDARSNRLREAFNAYQTGAYEQAGGHYEAVLVEDPDNRDALLGLAAIAVRRGELQQAVGIYARLLQLNPRDSLARAALINLGNAPASQAGESSIKLMLQENPDQAFLHFALGNLYARQARWPEAQQAFFDAWRLDSASPAYALNLAISLDRLGKAAPALEYYRTALGLAAASPSTAGIDTAALESRIRALEGALQQ